MAIGMGIDHLGRDQRIERRPIRIEHRFPQVLGGLLDRRLVGGVGNRWSARQQGCADERVTP
jgi:hypothetical protein